MSKLWYIECATEEYIIYYRLRMTFTDPLGIFGPGAVHFWRLQALRPWWVSTLGDWGDCHTWVAWRCTGQSYRRLSPPQKSMFFDRDDLANSWLKLMLYSLYALLWEYKCHGKFGELALSTIFTWACEKSTSSKSKSQCFCLRSCDLHGRHHTNATWPWTS